MTDKKDPKWKCANCGKIISHPFQPLNQFGGKCAKSNTNRHVWIKK